MSDEIDPRCMFSVEWKREGLEDLLKMLDPDNALRTGCRVHKEPGACILCVANEDCDRIPLHVNCFPAGTVVSGPSATASIARWYSGELVEFETRLGAVLAATPNHPILTPQGWIGAGFLREGDQVVRESRPDGLVVSDPDDYQQPALIEEVASTFGEPSKVLATCVPVAAEDLHGDGMGSDVAVVRANGLLQRDVESARIQETGEGELVLAGVGERMLSRNGSAASSFERVSLAAPGFLGGRGPGDSLLGSSPRHHEPVSVTDTSEVGQIFEELGQRGTANSALPGKGVDGLAGSVAPDQVVRVRRFPFSGHVYNLETRCGWYVANSIVVHNCRCKPEPYLEAGGQPA